MKRFTFILSMLFIALVSNAQIVYPAYKADGFEAADGFTTSGADKFTYSTGVAFATPKYTGTFWRDLFYGGTASTTKPKIEIFTESRTGSTGTECLKVTLYDASFADATTTVRLRSRQGTLAYSTGETLKKYVVTFWARVDGEPVSVFKTDVDGVNISVNNTWTKYTISKYSSGVTAAAIILDFLKGGRDYVVYIDDLEIMTRTYPVSTAATFVTGTSFTANWNAFSGATGYTLEYQKQLTPGDPNASPVVPATWDVATTETILSGSILSKEITGLTTGSVYRYRVIATDGTVTTDPSNYTQVTVTDASAINTPTIISTYAANGKLYVNASEDCKVEIFNAVGQNVKTISAIQGVNVVALDVQGVLFVKSGKTVSKVVL